MQLPAGRCFTPTLLGYSCPCSPPARTPLQVKGVPVLKLNDYTLDEGERSVFDQELLRGRRRSGGGGGGAGVFGWVGSGLP